MIYKFNGFIKIMFEKNYQISYLLDFYGNILTEKQREAIDLYYNEDLSLAEIADHVKITRQGVRDAIKRGEETLLEMEEKLGFAEKFDNHRKAFEEISRCANVIRGSRSNLNFIKIIEENMGLIVAQVEKASKD